MIRTGAHNIGPHRCSKETLSSGRSGLVPMVSTPGSGSDGISSPTGADSMSDAELSSESDEHNTVPEDDDSGIAPPMQLPDQSLRIRLPPLRRHPHLSEGLQEVSSVARLSHSDIFNPVARI